MRIEVTAEDIALGHYCDTVLCPVALAIRRQCPSLTGVEVYPEAVRCKDGETQLVVELPDEAERFVRDFDDAGYVEPFAFEWNVEAR